MADNVQLNQAAGSAGDVIAADDIGGTKHQRVKVQHGADGSATDASAANPLPVNLPGTSYDAFGRIRVSDPITLFDSKQIHDTQALFWDDEETSGSGTSTAHDADTAKTRISVSATTAGTRVRQTFMRFNYQTGKSHLILMTGLISGSGSGITGSMGYYDDNNGIFVKSEDGTLYITRRTNVTGSAVDNDVAQSSWSGDKLDGSGASGYTLDPSKTQIFWIDLEWLGVGRVRCGFVIDGKFILCHEFLNANVLTEVYMSTPNLPLRYEISNDGTGGAAYVDHICSTVISEGGNSGTVGQIRSKNQGNAVSDCNASGTYYALVGIRLKAAYIGASTKITGISILSTSNDDVLWELRLNPSVAGTFTYADETNSAVQTVAGDTTNDPSTNTVTGGTVMRSGYLDSGGSVTILADEQPIELGAAIDGTVDTIVLCVTPLGSNADISGAITWREVS